MHFSDEYKLEKINSMVEEVSKTFNLSREASTKLVTLIDNMGLTLEDIKTMSLEEIQMRHGQYLLEKSYNEGMAKAPALSNHDPVPAMDLDTSKSKWLELARDLDILAARDERKKKQEEMAYVRETVPENYANRAERRRILRANKKGKK